MKNRKAAAMLCTILAAACVFSPAQMCVFANTAENTGVITGENTGTSATYTGYEPLNPAVFEYSENSALPTEKIAFSFGVAKDSKPHSITVANQKFFDDSGYFALAWDNKSEDKRLYLTFDCGYENGETEKILDILKEKNVPAAFFCTAAEVEYAPETVARMITDGHIVGNHTANHPSFAEISRKQMAEEISQFDEMMREKFGYSSLFFRFPKGEFTESALDLVGSMGFKSIFWSLAYDDWDVNNVRGAQYAVDKVTSRLHPGAVILLHAVSPDNTAAMADIIDNARSQGYEFYPLSYT